MIMSSYYEPDISFVEYYSYAKCFDNDIISCNIIDKRSLEDKYKCHNYTQLPLFLRACYLQCLIVVKEIQIFYEGYILERDDVIHKLFEILLKENKYHTIEFLYPSISRRQRYMIYQSYGFVGIAYTPFDDQPFMIFNIDDVIDFDNFDTSYQLFKF